MGDRFPYQMKMFMSPREILDEEGYGVSQLEADGVLGDHGWDPLAVTPQESREHMWDIKMDEVQDPGRSQHVVTDPAGGKRLGSLYESIAESGVQAPVHLYTAGSEDSPWRRGVLPGSMRQGGHLGTPTYPDYPERIRQTGLVADGYHRLAAARHINPDMLLPIEHHDSLFAATNRHLPVDAVHDLVRHDVAQEGGPVSGRPSA